MQQWMHRVVRRLVDAFRKGDLMLLLLCVVATSFGCLMIGSSTAGYSEGSVRYLLVQIGASFLGIIAYIFVSSIDAEFFSEHRTKLVIFNTVLLLMLYPFGVEVNGNRSWLDFPFLPFNIQPAEICKITYVLIMASVMSSRQNNLSSPLSIGHILFHLLILFGMNVVISGDWGVSLIFLFIFACMAFSGGISLLWFLLAGGIIAVAFPILWNVILQDYQKQRILVMFEIGRASCRERV